MSVETLSRIYEGDPAETDFQYDVGELVSAGTTDTLYIGYVDVPYTDLTGFTTTIQLPITEVEILGATFIEILSPINAPIDFPETLPDIVEGSFSFYQGFYNALYTETSSIFGTTLSPGPGFTKIAIFDQDGDFQFETGDTFFGGLSFTFQDYVGTAVFDGVTVPVFQVGTNYHYVIPLSGRDLEIPITAPEINSGDPFVFCFASGTQIATVCGEKLVESLSIGDLIHTDDGRCVPIKWIGRQTSHKLFCGPHMQPVRIRAGALGDGLPHSDLIVTADHGMIIDGLVINASALVNGTTIDWVPMADLPDQVTYYHIETENHDVILANGAPAETFVDVAGRTAFDNYAEYLDLYSTERIIPEMKHHRISTQRLLPNAIKARLGIVAELTPDFAAMSA
jgi:hypothetical protein